MWSVTMGKMQRNKGAAAEREVFKILADELGVNIKRDLSQTQDGGCDFSLANYACEIKRQEALQLRTWWKQACDSAETTGEIPAVIYRQSRQPWRVMLPFDAVSPMFMLFDERDDTYRYDQERAELYERTITIKLEPMFIEILRETLSHQAMEMMVESKRSTTH
jgi:hypothetical protein